jgi:hypothetical protein
VKVLSWKGYLGMAGAGFNRLMLTVVSAVRAACDLVARQVT